MKLVTKLDMVNQDYILIIEAGFALLAAGRIGEALDVFSGCHDMLPESELPYIGIARCFAADGKLSRAEEYGRRAIRAKYRSPVAHINLAEILIMQGKKEECLRIVNAISNDGPKSPIMMWKKEIKKLLGVESRIENKINKR